MATAQDIIRDLSRSQVDRATMNRLRIEVVQFVNSDASDEDKAEVQKYWRAFLRRNSYKSSGSDLRTSGVSRVDAIRRI